MNIGFKGTNNQFGSNKLGEIRWVKHMKLKLDQDPGWTEEKLKREPTKPTEDESCVNKGRTNVEHFLFCLFVCDIWERPFITTAWSDHHQNSVACRFILFDIINWGVIELFRTVQHQGSTTSLYLLLHAFWMSFSASKYSSVKVNLSHVSFS